MLSLQVSTRGDELIWTTKVDSVLTNELFCQILSKANIIWKIGLMSCFSNVIGESAGQAGDAQLVLDKPSDLQT